MPEPRLPFTRQAAEAIACPSAQALMPVVGERTDPVTPRQSSPDSFSVLWPDNPPPGYSPPPLPRLPS
jgi:hypothetical protein